MKAAVTELRRRVPRKRIAAIGFCFGGGMVWRLLVAGERRLQAAAPFYGPFPEGGDLRGLRRRGARRLRRARHARQRDPDAARAALKAAELKYQHRDASREADHAFFNDTGERFNAPAAEEAGTRCGPGSARTCTEADGA